MVAGPAGVLGLWKAVEWLVSGRVRRGEKAEEVAEEGRDKKLDEVLSVVQRMERELAVMAAESRRQAVALGNAEARISGMSDNYSARLGAVEQRMAVLDESMRDIKARRRR
jgi:hypothetical protein